jgi:hypothetical protein
MSVVHDPFVALRAATASAVVEALVVVDPDHPAGRAVALSARSTPEGRVLTVDRLERRRVEAAESSFDSPEIDLSARDECVGRLDRSIDG